MAISDQTGHRGRQLADVLDSRRWQPGRRRTPNRSSIHGYIVSPTEAQRSVKQVFTHLAPLSLTGGVSSEDAAVILRRLSATLSPGGPTEDGVTLDKDQVNIRGVGRRPASLLGREVVVTVTWQVVREFEDGCVTVALADSPTVKRARKTVREKRSRAA